MWSVWWVFCDCGFHSFCPLMDKDKSLVEASWWERLMWDKLGLVLVGKAMPSKCLIQFSVDGWGCIPSLLFGLRPNFSGVNGDLLKRDLCQHCCIQCPWPHSRPLSTHASAGDSWTLTGKSGSLLWGHCSFLLGPGVHRVLFVPSKSLFLQSCGSAVIKSHWSPESYSLEVPLLDP